MAEGGEQGEAPAPWWKCVVAALPELAVGVEFLRGARPQWLAAAMQAEFLVIHSMAFLGLLALWKPAEAAGRKTRAVAFWGLFALYTVLALSAGFKQLLLFVGLTFVTYLGLFLNWNSPSAMLQLGARWAVGFLLFIVALGTFGTPENVREWGGSAAVLRAGAFYFFGLAAVELSGLYLRVIPRNSARLLALVRKSSQT